MFNKTKSGIMILLIFIAVLPLVSGGPITVVFGETVSGSIDPAGEVDTYVFSAFAGDTVLVRMSQVSGSLWPELRLYSPNGTELGRNWSYAVVEVNCTLGEDGEYAVEARSYFSDYTGNYGVFFQRLNNPGNAVSTVFGVTVSGFTGLVGEVGTFSFSAAVGDLVLVRMSRVSGYLWPEIRLFSSNGIELCGDWSYDIAEINCTLSEDGGYTVLAHDHFGDYTGNYSIFIQRLDNPGNVVSVVFGATVLGSIDPVGEVDTFGFSAVVGDTVLVRTSWASGYLWPEVRLFAPDGTELKRDWSYGLVEINCTLAEDGNYTVLVHDHFGEYTGNYTLYLGEIVLEELALGIPYSGNISTGEWHSFYVNVEADKNLLLTLEPASPSGVLELYGSYAKIPTRSDYDSIAMRRNALGNYELLISPTKNGTYYFGIYGRSVESIMGYRITASNVDRHVSDIYPGTLPNSTKAMVHISGVGFTSGMKVELRDGNAPSIFAETVVLSSPKMLIAYFNLSGALLGIYDIAVVWSDDYEETIQAAVEVSELRKGALYSLPEFQIEEGTSFTLEIVVPDIPNLFITLQKTTLVNYGDSWLAELSLWHQGEQVASTSDSHDLILHIVDPEPGTYVVNVTAMDTGSGILNVWASLPELPLGEWVVGTIYCSYGSTWCQVEVLPDQNSLVFEAEAMGWGSHFDIFYQSHGSQDHWVSSYGVTTAIEIPSPVAGTYIVELLDSAMIYGEEGFSQDQTREILIRADTKFSAEPPPNYQPTITSISTNRGGNTGPVTIKIKGGWLDPDATVSLVRSDQESIVAQHICGDPERAALTATFDLTGKEPGQWDLVVTNSDGQNTTAPTQFTIETGGEAQLSTSIIGRSQLRVGRNQRYIVTVENNGVMDAYDYVLTVELPEGLDFGVDLPNGSNKSIPFAGNHEGQQVIPIWILKLSSGSKLDIPLTIKAPETDFAPNEAFDLSARLVRAPESQYSRSGRIEDISSSPTFQAIKDAILQTPEFSTIDPDQITSDLNDVVRGFMAESIIGLLPNIALLIGSVIVYALVPSLTVLGLTVAAETLAIVATIWAVVDLVRSYSKLVGNVFRIGLVFSATPEDKYGCIGFNLPDTASGESKRFVPTDQELYYKIDFWNKENATAPARDVFVKDQLDADLDWGSLRFEEIGFLNWTVELELCQYFNVYVDTRPDMDLIVNVEGTFDSQTGEIELVFRSLDPATMQTPEDPMAGFLPPINERGNEIGWVCFSASPKTGLPTGTRIENQAFVNFDGVGPYNPAPKEGPFINTIDSAAPLSWVKPLPQTQTSSSFTLEWEGNDTGGSGIRDYTIYVSENGTNYVPLLEHATETSTVFNGSFGHTYYFFCCARDNVGNMEDMVSVAEAATTLLPPPQFATGNLTVSPVVVKVGENVTISVLVNNTGGSEGTHQLVLKINGTTETTKNITLAAGASQNVTFIVSRNSPGNYTVEVDGLTAQFAVKAVSEDWIVPTIIIGIAFAVGAIIAIIFLKKRRAY